MHFLSYLKSKIVCIVLTYDISNYKDSISYSKIKKLYKVSPIYNYLLI